MSRRIEHRADFQQVRYANCWEDADVLCRALAPAEGKRILSIASAGDNALALLAAGAHVVAADLSAAQLACLELRRAAFRRLDYDALLGLLGVTKCRDRLAVYHTLEPDLPASARKFWAKRPADIRRGVIHAGRFENYFRTFRTRVLPWIHRPRTVAALLAEKDAPARQAFYCHRWDNLPWRLLFRVFFSRTVMGRLGRDPEFFRYVEGSVADRILQRTRHALTVLPTHDNPYLEYILTGNFSQSPPRYLRPEHFEAIRRNLDRLTTFEGPVEAAAERFGEHGFDGFNLSDIFEYLHPSDCETIYESLLRHSRPGARLAYWNMLARRRRPESLADKVRALEPLSQQLHHEDRAFFYSNFVLEEATVEEF